jgi:hypothetical protein
VALLVAVGCGRTLPLTAMDMGTSEVTPPARDLAVAGAVADIATALPPDLADARLWQWLNPLPSGASLRGGYALSPTDVWLTGAPGGVWRFDGTTVTASLYTGGRDQFFAVVARSDEDVWVAGAAAAGNLWHYDGVAWSAGYSLGTHELRALWGEPGASRIFAITGDGTQPIWGLYGSGSHWQSELYMGGRVSLRDVWASGAQAFAVGDNGVILERGSYDWPRVTQPGDGGVPADDPFASDKNYAGVWGASTSDVWAVFVDGKQQIGFTHFDGNTWRVAPDRWSCNPAPPGVNGHVMSGHASDDIIVLMPGCPALRWNGTGWSWPLAGMKSPSDEDVGTHRAAFSDGSGAIWGVGDSFRLARLDPARQHLWLSALPPAQHDNIYSISPVATDDAWANGFAGLLRWSGGGWSVAPGNRGLYRLSAVAADDLWGTFMQPTGSPGIVSYGNLVHFDGSSWSDPVAFHDTQYLWDVWMRATDDAWAVGQGAPWDYVDGVLWVLRYDGTSWKQLSVPSLGADAASARVFGLPTGEVWVTVNYYEPGLSAVLFWDGQGWTTAYQDMTLFARDGAPRPWAAAVDDVWIPGRTPLHFDGKNWTLLPQNGDFLLKAIVGDKRGERWAVGEGPAGGAIYRFDGTRFSVVLDTAAPLSDVVAGPDGSLWAVGASGATLRLGP